MGVSFGTQSICTSQGCVHLGVGVVIEQVDDCVGVAQGSHCCAVSIALLATHL